MSDSIRSVRFIPQINNIKPRGKTDDKKDKKEGENGFSNHMSADDNGADSTGPTHVNDKSKNSENREQNNDNVLSERSDEDFDNDCGSLLDTKI
jgi:hypothetical protein